MTEEKTSFLKNEMVSLFKKLKEDEKGKWGKMNAQQAVEHIANFFKVSTQKIKYPLSTPAEQLPRYKEFLLSDKQFRENTVAPMLPEDPAPLHFADMNEAIADLEKDKEDFFNHFKDQEEKTTLHPAFGELNFNEWVQLHHKHVTHHARQFGLM